ncbi:MAG: prolipoprotein diacylglyceryl transferase [Clostridiales bacterium]|nr:prolipoprotein diacylglyceryl transferase [Clostridiales bacterium]
MNSLAFISSFNWYGLLMATGIMCGVIGCYFAAKHHGLEGDVIIDMIIICLPLAIIGARIYHVVFDVIAGNSWTFAEFCGFSGGEFKGLAGLAIYGGLFGSIAGAVIFHFWKNRKKLPENKRVSFWQIADVGFAFIMLGQVIARWGNFTNGECYGEVVTNPAFQWAPLSMKVGDEWRTSIWFYESLWNFFGFFVLLYLYLGRHKSFDGFVFAAYGICYGIGRAWIEAIRVNDVLYLGGMRVSVFVSVLFIIMGVAIIATHIIRAKRAGKKVFIFVNEKKLNDDYYGYEKTKLAHPMPDIVFFKDRKKVRNKEEIIVDESGVAIKVKNETEDGDGDNTRPTPQKTVNKVVTKEVISDDAEDAYEDKWDD